MKKSAGAVIAAALLLCNSCGGPHKTAHPRLIYLLTIDALRSDLIGLRHNGKLVMPNLSAFTKESIYFGNTYSQAPFTKISVASMFTGLWPSRLGVKHCRLTIFPGGAELCRGLDYRFHTLAEYLSDLGYDTLTTLFTAHVRRGDGLIQGFSYQEESLPRSLDRSGKTFIYHHVLGLHSPYEPTDEALRHLEIPRHSEPDPTRTDWYWKPLTRNQGNRLHEYYLAEGYDWDRRFGELVRELRQGRVWDDALVIVTADHGEAFLEHGITRHSSQLYDEVLRVPLFIKFPAESTLSKHHGSRLSNRVRLIDVFPTIAHYLGQQESLELDGSSLIPLIENTASEPDERPVLAFTSIARSHNGEQVNFEIRTILSGRFKAVMGYRVENSQLAAFDHKRGDEIRELFDLGVDPGEQNNLVSQHQEIFATLSEQYGRLATEPPDDGTGSLQGILPQSVEERLERERTLRSLGYIQ